MPTAKPDWDLRFCVQTRAEDGGLEYFKTVAEALAHARSDEDVWKIGFEVPSGERVRLVRDLDGEFVLKQMDEHLRLIAKQVSREGSGHPNRH